MLRRVRMSQRVLAMLYGTRPKTRLGAVKILAKETDRSPQEDPRNQAKGIRRKVIRVAAMGHRAALRAVALRRLLVLRAGSFVSPCHGRITPVCTALDQLMPSLMPETARFLRTVQL